MERDANRAFGRRVKLDRGIVNVERTSHRGRAALTPSRILTNGFIAPDLRYHGASDL